MQKRIELKFTFTDADDAVRREGGLVVVDVDDVDAQGAGARQLRCPFVGGDDGQPVKVTNLAIQHNVGLDDAGEGRLDHERVVVITVHDVVDDVGIGSRITVRGGHLRSTIITHFRQMMMVGERGSAHLHDNARFPHQRQSAGRRSGGGATAAEALHTKNALEC